MAGIAGKSGGKRAGAGRKPAPKPPEVPTTPNDEADPLSFLTAVMQGKLQCSPVQLRAAIAAVQYTHTKKGDSGKKEDQADAAVKAGAGKFASAAPPLKLVNRK